MAKFNPTKAKIYDIIEGYGSEEEVEQAGYEELAGYDLSGFELTEDIDPEEGWDGEGYWD